MSLYIRVDLSFWEHRKTIRLRAAIGECALWIPPRLWSYAAKNQPDGDFSDYSDEEIAMLLGYLGKPQALLEALLGGMLLSSLLFSSFVLSSFVLLTIFVFSRLV